MNDYFISENKRFCKLFDYNCVSNFDLTQEFLDSIRQIMLIKLTPFILAHFKNECDTINIGLYDNGKDIRIWKTWII